MTYYSLHKENINVAVSQADGSHKIEKKQGFFNQNDPTLFASSDILALPAITIGGPGVMPDLNKVRQFKMFIPPGAISLNLTLFCSQQATLYTSIKFDLEPDIGVSFVQEDSFQVNQFKNGIDLQNAGGHINVYTKALLPPDASGENPSWFKPGWPYVNNHNQPEAIGQIQLGIKVNRDVFSEWYHGYDQEQDQYDLLSGKPPVPPVSEFDRGKQYAIDNPEECGIYNVKPNFDLVLAT